jgi:TRAP-type uncharacterized transport system substrate-binding protein
MPESQISKLSIAAGSLTDAWHPLGVEVATAVTQTVPHTEMSVNTTASRMEDLKLLLNGQVDFAFAYDYHIVLANQGQLMQAFPDAPIETLTIKCGVEVERPTFPDYSQPARVVLPLDERPLQLITTAATSITTLHDLRGKRISLGPPGSVSAELAIFVLEGLGFDLANEIVIETLTTAEAIVALEKGELDGLFLLDAPAGPETAELFAAITVPIAMIPIGDEEAAQIMAAHPGIFHLATIPALSYANLEAEVVTLAVTFVLAAMEDFPAEQMEPVVAVLVASHLFAQDKPNPQINPEANAYWHLASAAYLAQQGLLTP